MLDVTLWLPRLGASFPLAVGIHGWGGSKNSMREYSRPLAERGIALLSYSARGFGDSYGQTNLADVNVEGRDLRSVIAQVVDVPRYRIDATAVAVFGASYGGAHAWLAATKPQFESPRGTVITIRTVAPLATWSELTSALRPNGRAGDPINPAGGFKLSFTEALYIGGCRDFPVCSNYPAYLQLWNDWMVANEPNNMTPIDRQMIDGFSGYRSIWWQQEFWEEAAEHRIPIFLAQGWTDDLFPASEALRMYRRLKEIDLAYPVALYLGDVGHPRAPNKPEEIDFVIDQLLAWLAWYLKGEGAQPPLDVQVAITRDRTATFDAADVIRVPSYDQLSTAVTHHFEGAKTITFNPGNTSGVVWDPLVMLAAEELEHLPDEVPSDSIPGNIASYEVPVSSLGGSLTIAGEPSVSMTIRQLSPTGFREQMNVRLFVLTATGEKRLITRGTYTIDTGSPLQPIGTETPAIPMYGNMWELAPADTLRLEITNVDSPYIAPSRIPSATEISNVSLTIPMFHP